MYTIVQIFKSSKSCFISNRPPFCSRSYIASPDIRIYSPNFPAPYLNNERCSYTIRFTRDDICHFRLNFISFEVEPSIGCTKDYLVVNGERVCGTPTGAALYREHKKDLENSKHHLH